MHQAAINPDVVGRVTERRGGLRVFDSMAFVSELPIL